MAIARPVTKTVVSTAQWGIPITDAVNANVTGLAALQAVAYAGVYANGYATESGFQGITFTKMGKLVVCTGSMTGATPGVPGVIAPVAVRPPGSLRITPGGFAAGGAVTNLRGDFTVDGNIVVYWSVAAVSINLNFSYFIA